MRVTHVALVTSALLLPQLVRAQHTPGDHASHAARADSAFAGMQHRGRHAMGVDQATSKHLFMPLPDGGRIALQTAESDVNGPATVRAHMRTIADAFAAGNFDIPGYVHAGRVPGTDVMREKRALIRYQTTELSHGGEVRITTTDPAALSAVHEFLAFQMSEHRTGNPGGVNPRAVPAPARRRQ